MEKKSIHSQKIFLTGGCGFIGSYITMELAARGHSVTVLSRDKNRIPSFLENPLLDIVEGNLADQTLLKKLIQGKDCIIHNALREHKESAVKTLEEDTFTSIFLAENAADAGVKKFIYTSSTSVNDYLYGGGKPDGREIHFVDVSLKHTPSSFYGATKAATEDYLNALSFEYPLRINIIRPGYTFGNPIAPGAPTQSDNRFRELIALAQKKLPIELTEQDGCQFIWAGDLARLYADVCESNQTRKLYFGLSKKIISWKEIAEEIIQKTGSSSKIRMIRNSSLNRELLWDTEPIKQDFGLEFDAGGKISEHIDWILAKKNSPDNG